jgi:hypothetical protein
MAKSAILGLAVWFALSAAAAQQNENGYGPDPDGDSNPATKTRAIANVGATDIKLLDPRFRVMTFEPPPGAHGRVIEKQYAASFGVAFSRGLSWQICDGPRYGRYDSLCTYLRPPSGSFAAYYRDDRKRPLSVDFARPVCAVMMSIYPTGGKQDELFRVKLKARQADGESAGSAQVIFAWTQDTFRWRVMAGGFFLVKPASSVDVMIRRVNDEGEVIDTGDDVQFLIDDLTFVETGCDAVLEEIRKTAGFEISDETGSLVTRSAQ